MFYGKELNFVFVKVKFAKGPNLSWYKGCCYLCKHWSLWKMFLIYQICCCSIFLINTWHWPTIIYPFLKSLYRTWVALTIKLHFYLIFNLIAPLKSEFHEQSVHSCQILYYFSHPGYFSKDVLALLQCVYVQPGCMSVIAGFSPPLDISAILVLLMVISSPYILQNCFSPF